ncbi:MAG: BON domain-containing protein [Pseudomonadales bacterium]
MARHGDDERRGRRGPGDERLIDRIMRDVASWFESEPDLHQGGHGDYVPDRQRERRRQEDRRGDDDRTPERRRGDTGYAQPRRDHPPHGSVPRGYPRRGDAGYRSRFPASGTPGQSRDYDYEPEPYSDSEREVRDYGRDFPGNVWDRDFGTESGFGRPYGDTFYGGGGKYRGVGPKGYKRSPEQLKERIAERLAEHDQINASEIEIEIDDDEVTLTGRVPSRRQKRLAEDCAESLLGIRDVHNRLTVDPEMEQGAS